MLVKREWGKGKTQLYCLNGSSVIFSINLYNINAKFTHDQAIKCRNLSKWEIRVFMKLFGNLEASISTLWDIGDIRVCFY